MEIKNIILYRRSNPNPGYETLVVFPETNTPSLQHICARESELGLNKIHSYDLRCDDATLPSQIENLARNQKITKHSDKNLVKKINALLKE